MNCNKMLVRSRKNKVLVFLMLWTLLFTSMPALFAQGTGSGLQATSTLPNNNWSEIVEDRYKVRFEVVPATCFNNGYIKYAIEDAQGNILTNPAEAGFDQVQVYYQGHGHDSTRHYHGLPYSGGWDSMMVDYGDYIFGVSAIFDSTKIGEVSGGEDDRYVKMDTNISSTVPTTYVIPTASAIPVVAVNPGSLGRLSTLSCLNTGRIQLKIENGRYPYTITVRPHAYDDSLYRTEIFTERMYHGTDLWRYDYEDYYSIDSLPAGDWDFYLVDGCGYGLPRTGQTITVFEVPSLTRIEVYASSGNMWDTNVVRINSVLKLSSLYYFEELRQYMSYRFYPAGEESGAPWKEYPNNYTLSNNVIKTVIIDTMHNTSRYCDFWERDLVYEYRFAMNQCDTFVQKDTFHYYKPNADYFEVKSQYVVDEEELDECGRVWTDHRDSYSIHYRAFQPNYVDPTTDDDNIWRRYHYTRPIRWVYLSPSGDTISADHFEDIDDDISKWSSIYASDFIDPATGEPMELPFDTTIVRRLVGELGCVLYEDTVNLLFERRMQSSTPHWEAEYHATDHCCETPRTIKLSEVNSGNSTPDSTIIELVSSPYNNFYNFKAVYNASTGMWEVTKDYVIRNDMEFVYFSDGRSLEMMASCLPGGPYTFHITNNCVNQELFVPINFPEIYSHQIISEPKFEVRAQCSDMYVHCTQGKVVRISLKRDPNTGIEQRHIDTLTTYYEIVDGPPGGYERSAHTRYMLKDSIRISLEGTYVIRVYPDESHGELCANLEFFDTIHYSGNAVEFDFALALLCDSTEHYGNAYVKATSGTPPYRYEFYSEGDMQGKLLLVDTLPPDEVFMVPSQLFVDSLVELSTSKMLSCFVSDACNSFYHINFYPQTLADLQKTWFDGNLKATTSCEGSTIHIHALQAGDLFRYEWSGPNGFYDTTSNPIMFIPRGADPGYYKVTIMETGCEGEISDSIYLDVKPSPNVTVSGGGLVCPGDSVELQFFPVQGDTLISDVEYVTFSVAFENAHGIETREFTALSGDTVSILYSSTTATDIYPVSAEDDECGYTYQQDGDTVHLLMREDVLTPCQISTWHDTVCYGGDAQLFARTDGNITSDSESPSYIRWFADYNEHHLLKIDTLTDPDQRSEFDTAGIRQRPILYVSVEKEGHCPSTNGAETRVLKMGDPATDTLVLQCADQIRFYDQGGEHGDYPQSTGSDGYMQIFTTSDHRPVSIHFDSLDLATTSRLFVFSGTSMNMDSVIAVLQPSSPIPEILTSRGDTMMLYFMPGPVVASGWSAIVSVAPGMAIADVRPYNTTAFRDEICTTTGTYTPSFPGWQNLVSQDLLDILVKSPGTRTFSYTTKDIHQCDSLVTFTLKVKQPPVRKDTTVVITSLSGGVMWHGLTYTETGQYTFSASESEVGDCDSVDRLNLIVLKVDTSDNEICLGDSTELHVSVETPLFESDFETKPTVGDVVCLHTVTEEGIGSHSETLILRPDSFQIRALEEELLPIGVVFYVDPENDAHGLAIALTDAYDTCIWSSNNNVTNGNRLGGDNMRAQYLALNDLNGKSNTRNILTSAQSYNNATAPAATYCYNYDHVSQTSGDVHLAYPDWYLPSSGELYLYFAQRTTVNSTLLMLQNHLQSINSPLTATVPFYDNGNDTGYWTSTEYTLEFAGHLNQKGQLRNHRKNGDPTNSSYSKVIKYVRAIFAY